MTGNCNINPFPGEEYIFIYPNPTSGPFQFATPTGVTIQRVEVFDARGRMVMFKEYSEAALQYNMDLSGVQSAVYILKLFTSEGTDVVRVLID
ncbi:T9SS type A sorting domain-containing protein [Gillisia sp. Hel_I_86]|uniref:T9SS type A sorting domain-containing protein n=1 Tax=Gillisia sp. Hel_I_86 TaxID=1249981 RepID=UPI0011A9BDCA|nr:T9SS type A sorting domain-containing protein [Gillisia sp. Hel_I_86]